MGFKMGLSQTLSGVDVKLGIRCYKNRLRLFENRVLERILDLRGVKYIRMEKIKKHNEELNNLYSPQDTESSNQG
jgi:hypothetical protein